MPRNSPLTLVSITGLVGLSVVLGGCGSKDPQIPTAPSSTVTRQASFPLTVSRLGGIAGFTDDLSIQDDGGVLATTKQGQVTCTIDKASLAVLNDAALQVHDTDQPSAPTSPPADAMTVVFGAGTGLLSIDDPRVAKAEPVVTQLLADVTGPAAGRKICT
jgi:hypothetical protein